MYSRAAVAANFASFVVLGVSGVATNVVLGLAYGSAALGAFNQVLSLYIVGAQLAAGGTHLATMRLVPLVAGQVRRQWSIVVAALVIATMLSLTVAAICVAARPLFTAIFDSALTGRGILPLAAALLLCGANKVLLGALNAVERHAAFALVQASRPVVVFAGVTALWWLGADSELIFLTIPASELMVLGLAAVLVAPLARSAGWESDWRQEMHRVRAFAVRVFPGGLIAEANSRVDILVLGILASDKIVGVYSFASMFAEGLAQLPSVIRNSINARVAQLSRNGRALRAALPGLVRFGYLFLVPLFLAAAAVYYLIVQVTLAPAEHSQAYCIFGIILACLMIVAGALPFDLLLSQIGFPGRLSALRGAMVVFNILCCVVLYDYMGVYGIALSVGLTVVLFSAATLIIVHLLPDTVVHA